MKILVCGGRGYYDYQRIAHVLDALNKETMITELIHGDARGADRLAGTWAETHSVRISKFPADWNTWGKAAGYVRNVKMANEKPDLVVAFPGGEGTAMMIQIAKERGIPVQIVEA